MVAEATAVEADTMTIQSTFRPGVAPSDGGCTGRGGYNGDSFDPYTQKSSSLYVQA